MAANSNIKSANKERQFQVSWQKELNLRVPFKQSTQMTGKERVNIFSIEDQ